MTTETQLLREALQTIKDLMHDRLFTAEWASKHGATVAKLEAALTHPAPPAEGGEAVAYNYKQAPGSKNCMQCAVAYMLGLPIEAVPDFEREHHAHCTAWELMEQVFESHGCTAEMFPPTAEITGDYLASGTTKRGTSHMVVMRGGKLLHDPHPSNDGLDAVQVVWIIARKAGSTPFAAAGQTAAIVPLATHNRLTMGPASWTSTRVPLDAWNLSRAVYGTSTEDDEKRLYRSLQAAIYKLYTAPPASHVPEADFGNNQPASQEQAQQPSAQAWANETGLRQIDCPSCGDLAVAYDPQQPSGETFDQWLKRERPAGCVSDMERGWNACVLTLATPKPEPMTWQPIETAPKGHAVLLWLTRGGARCVIDDWGDYDRYNHPRITHWMPLPPAPITKGEA